MSEEAVALATDNKYRVMATPMAVERLGNDPAQISVSVKAGGRYGGRVAMYLLDLGMWDVVFTRNGQSWSASAKKIEE